MRRIFAVALAMMFFLNSVNVGRAQEEECIKCVQVRQYVCTQDLNQCFENCRRFVTSDRDSCRRRCNARGNECARRTAIKCGTCLPPKLATPPPARIQ